jgi:DHA1 family bicyclomycin/chloramphenicol resistance-like MFS transporter
MGLFFALIASTPHVVVSVLGYSATVFGVGFSAVAGAFVLGNLAVIRYAGRAKLDRMVWWGSMLALGGAVAMIVLLLADQWTPWAIFGPAAVIGLAIGVVIPNAQAGAVNAYPDGAGLASGVLSLLQLALGSVLIQLVGASLGDTPYPMALWLGGVAALGLAVARRRTATSSVG